MKKRVFIYTVIMGCLFFCACSNKPKNRSTLSEIAAQKIALQELPGATIEDIKVFRLDNDNGLYSYEGTIIYKNQKYEFEIDANDGTILEWNMEPLYD